MRRLAYLCVCGGFAANVAAAPLYHAVKIDFGTGYGDVSAVTLNNNGTVLVNAQGMNVPLGEQTGWFLWSVGQTPSYIPWMVNTLSGRGLSDDGTIIGSDGDIAYVGTVMGATRLNQAPFGTVHSVDVRGINKLGQEVGQSDGHVAFWQGTTFTDLGNTGGAFAIATVLNNMGLIAGVYATDPNQNPNNQPQFPFLLDHGNLIHLPTLPGSATGAGQPNGINDNGIIVGSVESANPGHYLPAVWTNGQLSTLPLRKGDGNGVAAAINNSGVIIGYSGFTAVEWVNGQIIDLDASTDSKFDLGLFDALGINDSGQIVANALDGNGNTQAYLLTPINVPEPSGLTLLAASAAILLHRRPRRAS